ncbi:MAG: crosslink repair DNA glycosylase YcaQ family protein [Ideonella sp.]
MSRLRPLNIDTLRRYAIARSLFKPSTLPKAIRQLGFVQADPIRAPARAQDLILRHRVVDYRAGDLEKRYPRLDIDEDFFINYGFMARSMRALMHPRIPRIPRTAWSAERARQAASVLAFVHERGVVHPRDVDAQFAHGKVLNWFGGSSKACTVLLDEMHYHGLLRIARRDAGTRLYAASDPHQPPADPATTLDALVDVVVRLYAPLPEPSLGSLMIHLRGGAPQWAALLNPALSRAKLRLRSSRLDGVNWFWPADENPASLRHRPDHGVRLLAPFDPIVWDRRRFEHLWGWAYRFEAYTPAARRLRGHYALPLLWHEHVIGWGNLSVHNGRLNAELGFVAGHAPGQPAFRAALDAELASFSQFLGVDAP